MWYPWWPVKGEGKKPKDEELLWHDLSRLGTATVRKAISWKSLSSLHPQPGAKSQRSQPDYRLGRIGFNHRCVRNVPPDSRFTPRTTAAAVSAHGPDLIVDILR